MQDLLTLSMFGGFVGFVAANLVLLFLFFYAEYKEQGFIAFVAVLGYLIANHYWGNVPIKSLFSWLNISVYLGTGLVYAAIKTYFYGRSVAAEDGSLNRAVDELKGHVFRWWFIWPVSLISWLVSDFIIEGFELLWDNIGSSFRKILTAGYESKKPKDATKPN
jgi:hypothetical protein